MKSLVERFFRDSNTILQQSSLKITKEWLWLITTLAKLKKKKHDKAACTMCPVGCFPNCLIFFKLLSNNSNNNNDNNNIIILNIYWAPTIIRKPSFITLLNNHMRQILTLTPFCKWVNWGSNGHYYYQHHSKLCDGRNCCKISMIARQK